MLKFYGKVFYPEGIVTAVCVGTIVSVSSAVVFQTSAYSQRKHADKNSEIKKTEDKITGKLVGKWFLIGFFYPLCVPVCGGLYYVTQRRRKRQIK